MITHSLAQCQSEKVTVQDLATNNWQHELSQSKISVEELLQELELESAQRHLFLESHQIPKNFPLRVTKSFIARMRKGDPHDPLLRQVLPMTDELLEQPGFVADPLDENSHNPVPGIVHKYNRRALFIVTQACAIHCRYCFRRHFPYQDNIGRQRWEAALGYIREDLSLNEVILSGGDPLSANDLQLAKLADELNDISHIERLRIHSRLPVVLPFRINASMLAWLDKWHGQKVMVIHANHPNELDGSVAEAIQKLLEAGVTVLNQSVLLRGVNDHSHTLVELSERLFDIGVLPYYLHQLDTVAGATHFAVDDTQAKRLIAEVSANLSGYLVPRLVRESAGHPSKQLI